MTFRALRKWVNIGTTIIPIPPPKPALLTPVSHAPKQRITISVIVEPPFGESKYSGALISCQENYLTSLPKCDTICIMFSRFQIPMEA